MSFASNSVERSYPEDIVDLSSIDLPKKRPLSDGELMADMTLDM